jgi:lipopolysaccharide transport system permease protein
MTKPECQRSPAAAITVPEADWTLILRAQAGSFWEWRLQLADVWRYRDLLWMFVRRDFVSVYKQTLLGPLWFFIQPLLTTVTLAAIFGGLAKVPTGGVPPMLFYLAGTTAWNCFALSLTKTSLTFLANQQLFSKIYFPRLVSPVSVVISSLIQFGIQLLLFMGFLAFYLSRGFAVHPHWWLIAVLTPLLMGLMGVLGLAGGMIISTLLLIYADLASMVSFLVQLAMFATPVIYALASVPVHYRWWFELNPMAAIIETLRAILLGGDVAWRQLGFAAVVTLALGVLGLALFNRVERNYVETL